MIDATTRKRWPIWVEIDSNATTPADTAVLIHPAKNFDSGHRYIVAMRNLKDSSGKTIAAPEGFRYYRDDLPSSKAPINAQRPRFDNIFTTLQAGRDRALEPLPGLGLHRRHATTTSPVALLHIRDDAFAKLGDTDASATGPFTGKAPAFTRDTDVDPATRPPSWPATSTAPSRCPAT